MPSLKDVRQSLVAKVLLRKHVCKVYGLWSQKEEEEEEEEERKTRDVMSVCNRT